MPILDEHVEKMQHNNMPIAQKRNILTVAVLDLINSLKSWRLWSLLGWIEIRQRYARSKIGPFWLTISMGVMVATIGVVYGGLFGENLSDYLPSLSIGMVSWYFFAGVINEGSLSFIASAQYIRQVPTPRLIYTLQSSWRNGVIFAHNFIIIIIVLSIFGVPNWLTVPYFFLGLGLLILNALWMAIVSGVLSARFRDLPQIVSSVMLVAFYITPIMFRGKMLSEKHPWLIKYNPFAYLIEGVREPLMGQIPDLHIWLVSGTMAASGWVLALLLLGRYHSRIPYWI
jgi:lipopolysaccharide transport system permease protein